MHRLYPLVSAVLLLLVAGFAARANAASNRAWTTYLRAYNYTDVLADSASVWSATLEAGLIRFDRAARTFESTVREPGGVASNHLTSLTFDRSGRLWVGTLGAGLSYLSADRTRWNLLNEFDGLPATTINSLTPEGDSLWIGTTAGLALWNGSTVLGTIPDATNTPFANDDVTGIVVAGDTLYVSTLSGVYRSTKTTTTVWTSMNGGLPDSTTVEYLVSDGRDVFAYSSDTTTWKLDYQGTPKWQVPYRWNGVSWEAQTSLSNVRAIDAGQGTVLASTASGLFRWTGAAWVQVPGAPLSRLAVERRLRPAIAPDGRYYGASSDGFFEQADGGGPWTSLRPVQPPGNNITNVAVDGARLYVTTFNEGVGRLGGGTWRNWAPGPCRLPFCDDDTTFANAVFNFALIVDRHGTKWISSWGTLDKPDLTGAIDRMNDATEPPQFTHVTSWPDSKKRARHTFAVSTTMDSAGGLWFGMDSAERESPDYAPIGIDYYDSNGVFVRNFGPDSTALRSGRILALTTDPFGRVWIGNTGNNGIQRINPATGSFDNPIDITPIDVRGLVAAGDTVWAQTTNDVRIYLSSTGGFRASLPVPAGPSDIAGHPLEVAADGSVWAGTNNGIRVYRRNGSVLEDFTTANSPLAGDDVRAIRADRATGVLWIGTASGLQRFDPHYVTPPPPEVARLEARVFPNPARLTALGIGLHITGNTSGYRGTIYDLTGRLVHRFAGAANADVVWDGRDQDGRLVQPGIYFLDARAGRRSALVRIVLLH